MSTTPHISIDQSPCLWRHIQRSSPGGLAVTTSKMQRVPRCFPKLGWAPKMDGENNGKPYFLMDDLGVPLFLETPILGINSSHLLIKENPYSGYTTKKKLQKLGWWVYPLLWKCWEMINPSIDRCHPAIRAPWALPPCHHHRRTCSRYHSTTACALQTNLLPWPNSK